MTHRQSHAGDNFVKPLVIHTGNSGNDRNIARFFYRKIEGLCRRVEASLDSTGLTRNFRTLALSSSSNAR